MKYSRAKNLLGNIYGDYKVINKLPTLIDKSGNYYAMWECECILCGYKKGFRKKNLVRKNRNPTCKCNLSKKQSELAKKTFRRGTKNITGTYWCSLRNSANRRKIKFNITIEEAQDLLENQNFKCSLTNIPLTMNIDEYQNNTGSLDRIDPNECYTLENVQWVHRDLNYMKYTLLQEEFINYCKLVAENN